jgi:PGF-pre-PGF domain-containing protein
MGTGEKIYSTTLALTALVFLIFILFTVQPVHGQLILTETRITTDEAGQPTSLDIHGDRIIWIDKRHGNYDIYMYNISTSTETQITSDITSQLWPDIYGDRIVWQDERNGNYDIYMYNLSTSTETQITYDNSDQKSPVIYGDRIIWSDNRNGNWDIYMYDLSTSLETQITTDGADQYASALYGDRIVSVDGRNGNFDLYMYNLSTLTETRLTTNGADQYSPAIYGDRIVWLDYRDGVSGYMDNGDIYMYDLSTSTEVKLNTGAEDPQSLAIYGDRIIYIDIRSGKEDLYMYDLSDSTETQITNNGRCIGSGVYGNRIVWETYHYDNTNYISEIYMSTITEQETPDLPVASFNSNITSGYAPLPVAFTDLSLNATSRNWDFGDGTTSKEKDPVHTYLSAGNYFVNLTVSNGNNVASKTATINVLASNSDDNDDSSDGGSHHSSSGGGGGGGGGSPEPAKNVEVKELSQVFITNGKAVKFDFTKNATCVVYVGFDAKKTVGKTTTIVEQLKNKSTLVSNLSKGEVYKYFNVWVGNSGFASSENIENPTICFKVEKSWLQDKNIDKDSITLNRYSNKTWEQLPVSLLKEDSKYLYFTADVSGYSFFGITGMETAEETTTKIQPESQTRDPEEKTGNATGNSAGVEQEPEKEENKSTPGFSMTYGVASLFALYLYKRK